NRCLLLVTTRSFNGGSYVGINHTSSKCNESITSFAIDKCPLWGGSKVPPNKQIRFIVSHLLVRQFNHWIFRRAFIKDDLVTDNLYDFRSRLFLNLRCDRFLIL